MKFRAPRVRTAHLTPQQQAEVASWQGDAVALKRAARAARRGLPPPPEPEWRRQQRAQAARIQTPAPSPANGAGAGTPSLPAGEHEPGAPDGAVARGRSPT